MITAAVCYCVVKLKADQGGLIILAAIFADCYIAYQFAQALGRVHGVTT